MEFKTHCFKYEGHGKYIPVYKFSEDDLDSDFATCSEKSKIADLIRQQADLTVRLSVRNVSVNRPSGYPLSSLRGRNCRLVGSGWVRSVHEEEPIETCSCSENTSRPKQAVQRSFAVYVQTASHVVYDAEEAKSAVIDLFYDDEDFNYTKKTEDTSISGELSRTSWRRKKKLQCIALVNWDRDLDLSVLKCVTHDVEVYHRLQAAIELLGRQAKELSKHFSLGYHLGMHHPCYRSLLCGVTEPSRRNFVAIVSHPHGLPKQVTLGALQEKFHVKDSESWPCRSCPLISSLENAEMLNNNDLLTQLCNDFNKHVSMDPEIYRLRNNCALLNILHEGRAGGCCSLSQEDYVRQLKGCHYCRRFTVEGKDEKRHEQILNSTIKTILESTRSTLLNDEDSKFYSSSLFKMSLMSQKSNISSQLMYKSYSFELNSTDSGFASTSDSDSGPEKSSRICVSTTFSDSFKSDRRCKEHTRSKCRKTMSLSSPSCDKAWAGCDEALYMPSYDAHTCPGSSGAPVLFFHQKTSTPLKQTLYPYQSPVSARKPSPGHIFHTHCTWRMGFHCSASCDSPLLKASKECPCCSHSCSCCDSPVETHRKKRGKKKLAFRNSTDCPGPPSTLPQCQEEVQGSQSLFQVAFNALKAMLKPLSSRAWPLPTAPLKNSEADMDNIVVRVVFPKGESKYCDIYFNTRLVKEEKERLLSLANEDYDSPENYKLELYSASGAHAPITLDDDAEILMYIDEIANDAKLVFVAKQEDPPDIGPSLGITLKH
ncbi:hypothetical protein EGW08_019445 [Elysia chlorotica]|uniref:Uncharacterized protein n=1 Tax=Elysia chlorotica TaxID=188477 RepID=A0A3S0ZQA7_ELYCH|nr:hypothetical protein EGW08_019445 [Elysia chlorotica]